jgi:hypothetical protein
VATPTTTSADGSRIESEWTPADMEWTLNGSPSYGSKRPVVLEGEVDIAYRIKQF